MADRLNSDAPHRRRIALLDELRGLSVLCMVFYHAFFLGGSYFSWELFQRLFVFFMPAQPFFASIFIAVSGISSRLSRSNLKRGLLLAGVALGFNLVTVFLLPTVGIVGAEIRFGILNFLSTAILIFALLSRLSDKINPSVGMVVCILLFALTYTVPMGRLSLPFYSAELPESMYSCYWLFPLGFSSESFYSADYFPLLPNIFMFFFGGFLGVYFKNGRIPEIAYKRHVPFIGWLGRRALPVYVLHMPVICLLFYIASKII